MAIGGKIKKHRILVVDDEPDIAAIFKRALEHAGYEVDTFNDPIAALKQIKANMYDLLILDIKMPKMSGFELYRKIIEIDAKPKVCFITAFEAYYDEFRRVFPNMHVKCFIRKPISTKDLIGQVREEIESPPAPEHQR